MKRIIAVSLFSSLISIGIVGCEAAKTSSAKQETKISTPSGTTTTTTETQVKKTGEKPPGGSN